jgi:hypothetical protein
MNCALVVQTCDKYEPFWGGFFNFMRKHWDLSVGCPMYFCNEEKDLELPEGFKQIKTGRGTFVENLRFILSRIEEQHVFYMLEDFWPTAPMTSGMFHQLYSQFLENDLDALQVSTYLPYYELERNGDLLRFKPESEWIFNFQARFWKKESFAACLTEPEISESVVGSAITAEIASDKIAREKMKLKVCLHHYFWYPITGVAYRGQLTEIGRHMENVANIDKMVQEKFSLPASSWHIPR